MATNAVKQFESQETENCCLNNSELNMHNQSQSEKTKNLECSGGPDPGTCENCGQKVSADGDTPSIVSTTTTQFIKNTSPTVDVCRICHCESENKSDLLITPCRCKGSMAFVHHSCLQQWIKSSGHKHCELCGFNFVMESKLKPFTKWEKLKMSKSEKRRVWCSVMFHFIAIICVVWSLYVLIERTTQEVGKAHLQWPFWTKLAVVVIGLIGGLAFMYIQCKTYYRLWDRLMTFNKVVYVQNRPLSTEAPSRSSQVEIPIGVARGMEQNCPDKNQCSSAV